ncbi:DnaJ domain-containing protein [Corallococcus exercitus]|uniref:DnaJ domain-containing protein n=1 Tax=Corallococcus exercitus TaxID=2316736 RepID=A0A7Y4KHL9_9BACT|nr:DnaJ domain-containing protein [Corallococcus exercitus]NOK33956.1 DnaJ domain-containing protein [Corallococcus exercitus]
MVDLYAVLGVETTADARDIRGAYLKRVWQYHPDRDPRPESTEHFLRIQAAYEELGDAAKRQRYDARHRVEAPRAPSTPAPAPASRSTLNIPRGRMSVKVRMH